MATAPDNTTGNANAVDQGLSVLVIMLRFQGIGADPEQLRHRFGHGRIGVPEMLRCAKELGLKARSSGSAISVMSAAAPAIKNFFRRTPMKPSRSCVTPAIHDEDLE